MIDHLLVYGFFIGMAVVAVKFIKDSINPRQ
jgi:hypothetical protein